MIPQTVRGQTDHRILADHVKALMYISGKDRSCTARSRVHPGVSGPTFEPCVLITNSSITSLFLKFATRTQVEGWGQSITCSEERNRSAAQRASLLKGSSP